MRSNALHNISAKKMRSSYRLRDDLKDFSCASFFEKQITGEEASGGQIRARNGNAKKQYQVVIACSEADCG